MSATLRPSSACGRILERHGKVDILVNSAGLNNPQRYWRDQTVESWNQVIRINLDGTFYCTHAVIPSMRSRKDGLVINISSWAGKYTSAHGRRRLQRQQARGRGADRDHQHGGVRQRYSRLRHLPGGSRHADPGSPPVPPSAEERARMLQPEDLGRRSGAWPRCRRTHASTRSSSARHGTGSTSEGWRSRRSEGRRPLHSNRGMSLSCAAVLLSTIRSRAAPQAETPYNPGVHARCSVFRRLFSS